MGCAGICAWPSVAPAQDSDESGVNVVLGLSLASTSLSFEEKLDANANFPAYALFGSLAKGRTFVTLSYADSVGTENVSEEDEIGDANRNDLDLNVGYRIGDKWTAFLGYKEGETEIDFQVRDTDIVQNEYYKENGIYLGASYSLRIGEAGTLSFTGAYIDFDSDLRFTAGVDTDDDGEVEPTEFDDLEGDFSGSADGYSVGISWVMPASNRVALRASWKLNDYKLEVVNNGTLFEPGQQLRYFEIGLLYAF